MNNQINKSCGTSINLSEHDVRRALCKHMITDRVNSLIQIAKESPVGIAADILTNVSLQYFHTTESFNILSNN